MQSLKINPSDTMSLLYSGLTRYYKNDFQGAFQDYSNAILKSKGFTKAYYNRGIARGQMKDYKGAVEDFTKAIILDPKYMEAYYNRGLANYFKKDSDNACLDWTRAAMWGSASAQKALDLYCKNVRVQ
jgi:tetratricopeptide (TPR) repeat protein